MPRIVTIVSPGVVEADLFIGAALARTPKFEVTKTPDDALFGIVPKELPLRPAIQVPHPMIVPDPREVERVIGVRPPEGWMPTLLTQCYVPHQPEYDIWVEVVRDVAAMSDGFAVVAGQVIELPDPWPWSRTIDGKWQADPAWLDERVQDYLQRTGQAEGA
ncbi:Uncharacterised protein [Actinomyces bovis]|uniref:Uncharacterized protein n=1 Tax=Actinomyces bovis TaxID=1658 RepID=A0ABY1VQC4_9ACTO|nr:hypothetical protein [Actinomyces bovis]SPT54331.1 Uncharacterised protein [Actinomyces bovis]VEG56281.1 Uncharacterised protein [Actinomyces israelii]